MRQFDDTIAAIASPLGRGGVGVIRISGSRARDIFNKVTNYKDELQPRYATLVSIIDNNNTILLDKALVIYFPMPNSLTGEDVIELQCHGGVRLLREILGLIIQEGGRGAEPGEFLQRAFLNGKISLDQIEGIIDLINANSRRGIAAAAGNMKGELNAAIKRLGSDVLQLAMKIEAEIDFPDDIKNNQAAILDIISNLYRDIGNLIASSSRSKIIREGVRVAIIGRPNVGKSSLLNRLLGEDRAIVTELPGTTRDTIEESFELNGIAVIIVDTAGIRAGGGLIEDLGIARSKRAIGDADLVLILMDAVSGLTPEDKQIINEVAASKKAHLIAANKIDLIKDVSIIDGLAEAVGISAVTGEGVERLKERIIEALDIGEAAQNEIVLNQRQQEALVKAQGSLEVAKIGIEKGAPIDIIGAELRSALASIYEISGEQVSERIIQNIFSNLCVGK
ncbi:tRNA uridine-5-carboxymethylaminomethyl(34) synthesis GTPase MnmE [candidate division WOR-1 bacterium RIFOXYB2_FULL_48_7]|uniref:tRNA modification GTPase MnmE n=1 Tax=candidate division WOR-1 bacterium RIFOXYB2_FULL_48_7 TaxID=1802583 RepID=A0A1F4TW32_UNCSA|nr:MAG: tRNA uridine-5-carboxymethylaminomethyl(34) synthesis GTPase MnmE [candidate division WOR-1 bacterium RIFOXYB2_FULL_48_7]